MCSVVVVTGILEILQEFMSDKRVFTTFDITVEARKRTDDDVQHIEVKNIINNEFTNKQMGSYKKELKTLNVGSNPLALIYYPAGKSSSEHRFVDVTVNDNGNDDGNDDDITDPNVIKITGGGRFNIPKKILDQVNSDDGSYGIIINGNLVCRSCNTDGRIRIPAKKTGISTNKCRISVDDNTDTITLEEV